MLLRYALCVVFVVVRALAVRGWTAPQTAARSRTAVHHAPTRGAVRHAQPVESRHPVATDADWTKAIPAALLAVSLGVAQALAPGTAVAISADDYGEFYKSSATANQPGFSFSLPKEPEKKKPAPAATPDEGDKPSFELPKFEAPSVPKFEAPKFEAPSVPKFEAPSVPKFEAPSLPKIEAPSLPKVDAPSAPKVDAPSLPKFSAPSLPKVSLPDVSAPSLPSFGGGGAAAPAPKKTFAIPAAETVGEEDVDTEALLADRAQIDERARAARRDFREADEDAKQVEAQGRKLRKIANEKKKAAQEAKDAACEYRPGGKLLCIRGFNSGF